MKYELILKNEKTKYYKTIRDLVAVFNLIGFIYLLKKTEDPFDKIFYAIFAAITAIYILIVLYERFSTPLRNDTARRTIFLWSAVGWSRSPYWWVSLVLIAFLFLDSLVQKKLKLQVSEAIIDYPSFPVKKIEWNELTNLVLKEGLITIDFKNNKIIQQTILNADISEQEFNEFCRIQLNK